MLIERYTNYDHVNWNSYTNGSFWQYCPGRASRVEVAQLSFMKVEITHETELNWAVMID